MTEGLAALPRCFSAAQVLASVGDGAYLSTSAVFFTVGLGIPVLQVGIGLTMAWSIGFAAAVPLGMLTDRLGVRTASVLFAAAIAAALVLVPFAGTTGAFLGAITIYAIAQTALSAARQTAVAALVPPDQRTTARARLQVIQNVGLGAGAAIGSVVLTLGTRPAFVTALLLDAAAFIVCASLLRSLPANRRPAERTAPAAATAGLDRRFLAAAAVNAVLLLYMPLLSVVLPLWVLHSTEAPPAIAAVAFLLNTIGVVLLQARVARQVRTPVEGARAVRTAGVLLLPAAALIGLAAVPHNAVTAAALILAGVVLETLAEVRFGAGSWALAFALAPETDQGRYQAAWNAGIPIARALGPVLLTGLVIAAGPIGWVGLGAVLTTAGAVMPVLTRLAATEPQKEPSQA